MTDLDITLFRAMERSHDRWHTRTSGTESEQAFRDRTLMAAEITTLRQELAKTTDALAESEQELRDLRDQLSSIDFE